MLLHLQIQNIVLIESLALDFGAGLVVLTGETGSGKSIVLDALGLVLGARAETRLIRAGAEKAGVQAVFSITDNAACKQHLSELGLEAPDDEVRIRRTIGRDGKGKIWVNDSAVGVQALKQIGETLLEVHGQHAQRGLLDASTHREVLDAFGRLQPQAHAVRAGHAVWQEASQQLQAEQDAIAKAEAEEEYLRHVSAELEKLAPKTGEEDELAATRHRMMQFEKQAKQWQAVLAMLNESGGIQELLTTAERQLDIAADMPEDDPLSIASVALIDAFDKASIAEQALSGLLGDTDYDPHVLEQTEERLFALRAAARKHQCSADALATKREEFATKLEALANQQHRLQALQAHVQQARADYSKAADALSTAREAVSHRLQTTVHAELKPLKLGDARFIIECAPLAEAQWNAHGKEQVRFILATNPGAAPGPLSKVASGGELSRLMLALKVALADVDGIPSMVFDEVDTGIGGAVADAVGQRLAMLAAEKQVFVVTHQPQVAAFGSQHLKVSKAHDGSVTHTSVAVLDTPEQREELARMLAGANITEEARAAADALMAHSKAARAVEPKTSEHA